MGNALKRGIPVAIIGEPNVGKSSLLNALLGDDRAIVSDIPGTTRDTVEETLNLDGFVFRFIDTAGLRHSDDAVENMGIERSRKAVANAQIVLLVHDATTPWHQPELDLSDKQVVIVFNKSDLPTLPTPLTAIHVSAKSGTGLDELKQELIHWAAQSLGRSATDDVLLSNVRHYEALLHVQQALGNVTHGLDAGTPADLLAVDLRDALYHLGTITGEVASDEILGNIFSRFGVGK